MIDQVKLFSMCAVCLNRQISAYGPLRPQEFIIIRRLIYLALNERDCQCYKKIII